MGKISIIIPAYNEERRIGKTLESYGRYFEKIRKEKKLDYEIVVVINKTTDKTEEVVRFAQKKNKNIKYLNFKRGGKGFAVIEGFKDALKRNNDLIGFVDADMATPPEEYWKLIGNIGNADGIIADRYLKGSGLFPKPTIQRILARKLFNFVIKITTFLPFSDTQCGAKLFKKESLTKVLPKLSMSRWAFDVDLLYAFKKCKFKVKALPTQWYDREYSKINFWSAGPWMALALIRLRIINSPIRRFIKIYDRVIGFISR